MKRRKDLENFFSNDKRSKNTLFRSKRNRKMVMVIIILSFIFNVSINGYVHLIRPQIWIAEDDIHFSLSTEANKTNSSGVINLTFKLENTGGSTLRYSGGFKVFFEAMGLDYEIKWYADNNLTLKVDSIKTLKPGETVVYNWSYHHRIFMRSRNGTYFLKGFFFSYPPSLKLSPCWSGYRWSDEISYSLEL